MSHTVKVNVELKNLNAVSLAAQAMGAQILGKGTHRLFNTTEVGLGIQLKGWRFPLVVHEDGTVAFDDYNGAWGDRSNLEILKANYALECVKLKCEELAWYHEVNEQTHEIVIHHPDGGTITVQRSGLIDAVGFSGTACAAATLPIEQAMGSREAESVKPEMSKVRIEQGAKEE